MTNTNAPLALPIRVNLPTIQTQSACIVGIDFASVRGFVLEKATFDGSFLTVITATMLIVKHFMGRRIYV